MIMLRDLYNMGYPDFHFNKDGTVTKDCNIGIVRNLFYEETRTDIGKIHTRCVHIDVAKDCKTFVESSLL